MEKQIKYDKILNIFIVKYRGEIDKNDKILIILKLKHRKKQMKMTDICYEEQKY